MCAVVNGAVGYQAAVVPLLSVAQPSSPGTAAPLVPVAEPAARQALGDQFTMFWLSTVDQGWDVALAPGTLDVEAARAAIITQLTPHYTPDQLALLTSSLHVVAQPYSEAQLLATRDAVNPALRAAGFNGGGAIGLCRLSDAIRVEVTIFSDTALTPEQTALVESILAPYGVRGGGASVAA